jgi:hypothetical protein
VRYFKGMSLSIYRLHREKKNIGFSKKEKKEMIIAYLQTPDHVQSNNINTLIFSWEVDYTIEAAHSLLGTKKSRSKWLGQLFTLTIHTDNKSLTMPCRPPIFPVHQSF